MKRYDFTSDDICHGGCRIEKFEDGRWVRWEDHKAEIERVTAEIRKHCPYDEWVNYSQYKAEKETYEKQIRELREEIEGIEAEKCSKDIENRRLHAELEYANQLNETCNRGKGDGVLKVWDVTECNCEELHAKVMGCILTGVDCPDYWICPKHGYKKR